MAELVLYDITHSKTIAVPEDDQNFGRHLFFECNDKHVSRRHGLIRYGKEGEIRTIFIKALHPTNHLYYRRNSSTELLELAKDESVSLKVGDQFGLLEKFFWYEVKAKEDGMNEENTQPAEKLQAQSGDRANTDKTTTRTSTTKRKPDELLGSSEEAGSSKRNRVNSEDQLPCSSTSSDTTEPVTANESLPQSIKTEPASPTSTVSVKPDPDAAVDTKDGIFKLIPTLPDTSTLRPSCDFGIRCYRGGRDHRDQFAHPGDRDYRRPYFPPAPLDAPFCPYGPRCYRRNPQHFVDFQHLHPSINTPGTAQGRAATNRQRTAARYFGVDSPLSDEEEEEEDEESMLDFGASSSDDYRPGSWDDDDDDDDDDEWESNSNDSQLEE